MHLAKRLFLPFALGWSLYLGAQTATPDVGSGSPNDFVRSRFTAAFGRNRFYVLVSQPPPADVAKIGTAGLYQLFQDAAKTSNVRLALIKADASAGLTVAPTGEVTAGDVYQVYAAMWSYVASVNGTSVTAPGNLNTSGFPTMDTASCESLGDATCLYQTFDKKYVLFAYSKSLGATVGQNFTLRDPYYTLWSSIGGLSALGPAVSAEQAATSIVSAAAATWQQYRNGAIVNITSGTLNGRTVTVRQPVYDLYLSSGGPSQFLGFPIGEARVQPSGAYRQSFEGGVIEYSPGGTPALLLPVSVVSLGSISGPLRLKLGETAALSARLFAANGEELTGRSVAWTTSNGRVVAVEGNGASVTLRAVGGGSAQVKAVSEGKVSAAVSIFVSAACCQAGEGAPTAAVATAITDAIARNRLQVRLPTPVPVQRIGPGYAQDFQDAATSATYRIAVPDNTSSGYLLRGALLARHDSLGGLAGQLGYPVSDATAGGRQMFANRAALAGLPVFAVQGNLLDKWAALGYETGAVGLPVGEPSTFLTFTATAGLAQPFSGGVLYTATAGAPAGRTLFVSGAFLQRYAALEGPVGPLGAPLSDELGIDGGRRQEFEGGSMDLPPGATEVQVTFKDRQPVITATPDPVTAGGRVRLAAGGFEPGANLRVSVSGQADFLVTATTGAYAWEVSVPSTAASSTVTVRAVSPSGVSAQGSYKVRSLVEAEPRLSKIGGDSQTGPPGALLPEPIRIALLDSNGNPVPGVPVIFEASPGASIQAATAVTDSRGEAYASLRLPPGEAIALATAAAARQVVTFQARAAAFTLTNFPKLRQNLATPLGNGSATISERGALLASVANLLKYHQDRGDLPVPNGPADVAGLNTFLKNVCVPLTDPAGGEPKTLCDGFLTPAGTDEQIVNLWRLPAFTGGAGGFETGAPTLEAVRDWLTRGSAVLTALQMEADGSPAGMHYVVATGVAADGSILAFDSGDFFGRTTLNGFLTQFPAGGRVWQGQIASILRLTPAAISTQGFVVRGGGDFSVAGPRGGCSTTLHWWDRTATSVPPAATPAPFGQVACDGAEAQYQAEYTEEYSSRLQLTTMAPTASTSSVTPDAPSAFRIARGQDWVFSPQSLELSLNQPPVNAANLQPELAPGSLMAVFGQGLSAPGAKVKALLDGAEVPSVQATAFRLNLAVPPDTGPGTHNITLDSPLGTQEFSVSLAPIAPAIFISESGAPLITNEDGQANGPQSPAKRGRLVTIYATGLGPLSRNQTIQPIEIWFGEQHVSPKQVTAVSELPGLYQIQVSVPVLTAPGKTVLVQVLAESIASRAVEMAIE